MSAGRGTGSRLTRKRKIEDSSQSQLSSALHDITDDFEDISTVFRLPKKSKIEKLLAPAKTRGRPPKKTHSRRTRLENIATCDEDDFSDTASGSADDKDSQDLVVIKEDDGYIELDDSFLNKDEKLCRSCKHIVPEAVFNEHLKECFQKFKLQKNAKSTSSSNLEHNPEEKISSVVQEKENLKILPCPLCLKPFKSRSHRQSHIKTCAQKKGLSSENVISAVRLQEKQAEERIKLGLPVVETQPSGHEEKTKDTVPKRGRKKGTCPANTKDPDLAMAIALSRSVAEQEAEKRASQEEKLLALGLDHIVEEDRKVKPVVLLPCTSSSLKANKEKGRGRARGRRNFQNTVLANRSVAERERIVSEKVALILTSENATNWKENTTRGGRRRLAKFQDENCTLWNLSSSNVEVPLEKYYVDELEAHIKPKKAEVGRLLKRLSDIPGRLNVTAMYNANENSDSDSEVEEASIVDEYCTQLAMAELLGSQELNMTRANGSLSTDLSSLDEPQGPGSNITLEAASGFWLIHSPDTRSSSVVAENSVESEEWVKTLKDQNTCLKNEKSCRHDKNQEISNEDNMSSEDRPITFSKSETPPKNVCVDDSKLSVGDDTNEICINTSDSSEGPKLILSADSSSCETDLEQKELMHSVLSSECENHLHTDPCNDKDSTLVSSYSTITSPKKMCRISLSGHILSSLGIEKLKGCRSLTLDDDKSSEQVDLNNDKFSYRAERDVDFEQVSKTNSVDSQDSDVLCLLDTANHKSLCGSHPQASMSQGLPKRLSRSQQKVNLSKPLDIMSFVDNDIQNCLSSSPSCSNVKPTVSQQKAQCLNRDSLFERKSDDDELSDNSCSSDRTEIFDSEKTEIFDPDKTEVFEKPNNKKDLKLDAMVLEQEAFIKEKTHQTKENILGNKIYNKSDSLSKVTTENEPESPECIPIKGCNSLVLSESDQLKTDSESDEEGGAKTIIYDDKVSDEKFTAPFDNEKCEIVSDLNATVPFKSLEKVEVGAKSVVKQLDSMNKNTSQSVKSLACQEDDYATNVTSSHMDELGMDETKAYIEGNLTLGFEVSGGRPCNDTKAIYPTKKMKSLGNERRGDRINRTLTYPNQRDDGLDKTLPYNPEQRENRSDRTLPYEEYSKASETALHQVLEAFEETLPRSYLSTQNETVLYKDGINPKGHLLCEDISQMDDTLHDNKAGETATHLILEAFDETVPSRYLSRSNETVLHKDTEEPQQRKDSVLLDDTLPHDMVDQLMKSLSPSDTSAVTLNETVVFQDSNKKHTTALHSQSACSTTNNLKVVDDNLLIRANSSHIGKKLNFQDNNEESRNLKTLASSSRISNVTLKQGNILNIKQSSRKKSSELVKNSSMFSRLIYDWGSLLASGEESDVTITTSEGEELNAHYIVLLARCPELYAEAKNVKGQLTWDEISYEGAYIFLAYLYTGECAVETKDNPLWMDVFDLALKYKSDELISFLESLYKIANSPIKEKSSSKENFEPSTSKVFPKHLESKEEKVEEINKSVLCAGMEEPQISNTKITQVKLSTLVKPSQTDIVSNVSPRHSDIKINKLSDSATLSTPKVDGGNKFKQRKIVRRCLDLSPINKTLSLRNINSSTSHEIDDLSTDYVSSVDEVNKTPENKACSVYSSQSPDLFESSMLEENISYITTPAKSPLVVSPLDNMNVYGFSKVSPAKVDKEPTTNDVVQTSLSPNRNLPNLQSNLNVSYDENPEHHEIENELGSSHTRGVLHGTVGSHHISISKDAEENNSSESPKSDISEKELEPENVIDLTNDSSDESRSSFFGADNIFVNNKNSSKTHAPISPQEDMEPLKLADSEESEKEMSATSFEANNRDDNKVGVKEDEMAVDIICLSPKSAVSVNDDPNDTRPCDGDNGDAYISNVWDDFDDAGFEMAVGMPLTPVKENNKVKNTPVKVNVDVGNTCVEENLLVENMSSKENNKAELTPVKENMEAENTLIKDNLNADDTFDMPCLHEKESLQVEHAGEDYIRRHVSGSSTFKSSPLMAPPVLKSPDTSTKSIKNSYRYDQGLKKDSSSAVCISDETMAKIAGDIDDSNLWKEENEPIFEDNEGLPEHENCREKMQTPKQNSKAREQKVKAKNVVTPLPNYKAMPSPDLQKELKKFGLKPISRGKAVVLLNHVYEKTHPLVTDSEAETSYCDTPQQPHLPPSKTGRPKTTASLHERVVAKSSKAVAKNINDKPKKAVTTKNKITKLSQVSRAQDNIEEEEKDDNPLDLSQSSTSTNGSEMDCFEESMLVAAGDDVAISATQQGCLASQVAQFITSDPEFHQKVLLYEPFFVEDLQASLKANGVKCNMRNLLDILDDQCITFRTHQGQRIRQRGRKCKRKGAGTPSKSPKSKRTKNTNS